MFLVKFINKDGSYSYQQVDKSTMDLISNPEDELLVIEHDGKKYKFVGQKDLFLIVREITIKQLKLAELIPQMIKNNIKIAEKLLTKLDTTQQTVDKFIEALRIKQSDPKIQQIKQIKNQEILEAKDKIHVKILWWEAKRESLYQQLKAANLKISPTDKQTSFLHQVLEELNSRITKAVKQYSEAKQMSSKD